MRNLFNSLKSTVSKSGEAKYNILLLTNRDSDNVGDQVIEASDIALIEAVMKNLGVKESEYKINSHAAAIVTKAYVAKKDKSMLARAEELIAASDLVIFGGAPLFNYQYQIFYERTAVTLEIAQKHQKPVIFSAIGVESYHEDNEKCQRLKKTLNFDCVKQITTRDGFEELKQYKEKEDLVIDKVSDPAVFSAPVFRSFTVTPKERKKKKIGIFVFRSNGFKDNKIDFKREDAVKLWKDIIAELERKNYDYELLTSGHFGDEAFLDYMIRNHGISEKKCVFNMNCPEKLIEKISSYDGVISCRLHPSIISFSLEVPSVGIIWNSKVTHFYDCIGYADRAIPVIGTEASTIVDKLEEAMEQKIVKDSDYLITVYQYLFRGIQNALELNKEAVPYDYEALVQNIPAYKGTTRKEQTEKLKRKFRRIYDTMNRRHEASERQKEEIKNLKKVTESFSMSYSSGGKNPEIIRLSEQVQNNAAEMFAENTFQKEGKEFVGWCLRFRIGKTAFWYLEDGTYCLKDEYDKAANRPRKVFQPGDKIPYIPFIGVEAIAADAQWK